MILHTDGIHDKYKMISSNKNTQGVGYGYGGFRDSVDMGILWDSHRFFCGYGMGMGIKIQSPRQPCLFAFHSNYGDILYRLRDIATCW